MWRWGKGCYRKGEIGGRMLREKGKRGREGKEEEGCYKKGKGGENRGKR